MKAEMARAEINMSKIRGGDGVAGAIFGLGSMVIFLMGIPALWFTFPAAVALGCGVAIVLHLVRYEAPGASWLTSAMKK